MTRRPLPPCRDAETVEEMADRQLLEVVARGRGHDDFAERAFVVLVQRHGAMVLGVCRQLLGDEHAAEDAFQVTFLALASKAGSIERPELLGHWLYGVAVRTARKARRLMNQRQAREVAMLPLPAEPLDARVREDMALVQREQVELLHEELGRLPEKYRVPIVLCDLEGLTHVEAARQLGWPSGTLSVRLVRGRATLRARLLRRGLGPIAGLLVTVVLPKPAGAAVPPALAEATVQRALRPFILQALASSSGVVLSTLVTMTLMVILLAGLVVNGAGGLAPPLAARQEHSLRATAPATVLPGKAPAGIATRQAGEADAESNPEASDTAGRAALYGGASPVAPTPPVGLALTYRKLAARVGHDPAEHVHLALWCEARGLSTERLKHLSLAVLIDPDHETARGLLGHVDYRGRWVRPVTIAARVRGDAELSATLAEYITRRQKAASTADSQWKLALWCEQRGLKTEAMAHLVMVTRLDPAHEAAWKRLGCRRYNGHWLTEAQIAAVQAEIEAQKKANRLWKPILTKWRSWLDDRDRREQAELALAGICDWHAVPSVWAVFGKGGTTDQSHAVQILGQIGAPSATRALAILALLSPSPDVRRTACEVLSRRDPRDCVGLLVGLLRDPDPNPDTILYRFQLLPTGALGVGSPGIMFVEGRHSNLLRFYTVDESLRSPLGFIPIPQMTSLGYARRVAQQQSRQMRDLDAILTGLIGEAFHELGPISAFLRQENAQVIQVLRNITGEDRGDHWEAWKRWWVEELGYAYEPNQYRNPPDNSLFFEPKPTYIAQSHLSCFGAGTPVRTLTGPRPIELLRVGDVVLTQETKTGVLSFAPVLAVFHNRPAPTLRITLGDSNGGERAPIVATGIHRFWQAGQGWVMARDLKPGDVIRTLDGPVKVSAISTDPVQPVFNLEVGETRSFFVGPMAALVHDNSIVEPVPHPFDAVDEPGAERAGADAD